MDEMRLERALNFSVRMGLNSGEVVVGKIGDDLRMDYTEQGHTVGLAQRMEAFAESRHMSLSAHTARLVEGYFQLQDLREREMVDASQHRGADRVASTSPVLTRSPTFTDSTSGPTARTVPDAS